MLKATFAEAVFWVIASAVYLAVFNIGRMKINTRERSKRLRR